MCQCQRASDPDTLPLQGVAHGDLPRLCREVRDLCGAAEVVRTYFAVTIWSFCTARGLHNERVVCLQARERRLVVDDGAKYGVPLGV